VPKRIQRKRTAGWRMPKGAVYVGRPSRWGNPWKPGPGYCSHPDCGPGSHPPLTAEQVVAVFRTWLLEMLRVDPQFLAPLRGKDLACWCPVDQPCHADVLLEVANAVD
jgi:hypothetical protein